MAYTLRELAERIDAEIQGNPECLIHSVATITSASEGQISFLSNTTYKKYLSESNASAIVLQASEADGYSGNALIMENPYLGFSKIVSLFHPPLCKSASIAKTAIIEDSAELSPSIYVGDSVVIGNNVSIGENTIILAGTVISDNVKIGTNCLIHPNVSLYEGVILGDKVILHSGVVIGSDGFGIANDGGAWHKIPQVGSVVIGDNVEIGANSTIDRGALEDTIIENGVKIDNQVQVAHNCHIGEHTAIAACTGISGSTHIGKRCMIGGGVGFRGHLKVCDDVIITAFSGVSKTIHKPGTYSGFPVSENLKWRKNVARLNRLDMLADRLKELEKKLKD